LEATSDDLTTPLGLVRHPERSRFRVPTASIFAIVAVALAGAFAGTIAFLDDPLGGEPYILVHIERTLPDSAASDRSRGPEEAGGEVPPRRSAADVETASGVLVVRPNGTSAPGAVVIQVPENGPVQLNPAPDSRLVERTRQGPLPKIGQDGSRPLDVYKRPSGSLPGGVRPGGRIALLVGGLGISQTTTTDAIAKLPGAVTLAFAPYGSDLERQVARAREEAHEVMLQAPMEPFDYPDSDPGPHTLLARAKASENLERLHWVMSRFTGYTGVVNFMGAKLTSDEAAMAPILREIGGRGLGFLDDGSSSRSVATAIGASTRTPTARADLVLDGVVRADAIDMELARLETLAKERGLAVATASALPLTVDRIARWSRTLETRNILLVPISSVFENGPRR
jgi:polysaccharide deacetylase 2 family uncharacterized protein YibQ